MNRVIVENNTQQDISDIFSDLQDNIELVLTQLYSDVFQEFGVVAATENGEIKSTDLSLKITEPGGLGQVLVNPGHGITADGDILIVATPGDTYTLSGIGTHTLYLKPKDVYTEFVERIAGFQYGAGTATTPSRLAVSTELTEVDPGISGILLADVILDVTGNITSIDDRRDENLVKLNADVYDELDVVTLSSNSVVTGTLQSQVMAVKAMESNAVLSISGELEDNVSAYLTPSGLNNAHNWAHDHTASTFNPLTVTTTATALNDLMAYGIIDFDDGFGRRLIKTRQIPSQPNTPSGLVGQLYQYQQNSTFGQSLLADLETYRSNRVSVGAQTNKRNNLSNLSRQMTAWNVSNSGVNWEDAWTSADIVDAYGHTLSGLAQTIVDHGYATVDEVGFNGPTVGTTVSDLVTYVDSERDLADNERVTLTNTVSSVAETISIQAERVSAQPDLVRPIFKVKVTWDSPTLVDNEEIKKYVVKAYRVVAGDWDPVPTESEMTSVDENIDGTSNISRHETMAAEEILTAVGDKAIATINSTTSYKMVTAVSDLQIGDYVALKSDLTDKSQVSSITGTKTFTLVNAFTTAPIVGDELTFYRQSYEDTIVQRTHWVTVDRDQIYIIFVRPVSEYNIYGPWSTGYKFVTNEMTIGSDTLLTLMNARDSINRQVSEAQQVTLRNDLEETVAELSKQVSAQPDMVSINNLTSQYRILQNQVDNL